MTTQTSPRIERAADLLFAARGTGAKLDRLPDDAAPADAAEAWAIQQAVARRMGAATGGWKAGIAPGKPPGGALLPEAGLLAAPARFPLPAGAAIGIEAEIGFRLARDLPGRADGAAYARDEVVDAVAVACVTIELVESRYAVPDAVPLLHMLADSLAHRALVVGADLADWRQADLARLTVRLSIGGVTVVEQAGGNPAGDPVLPLVWLANALPALGMHLAAGQVVTTGSYTGLCTARAGQRVVARFEGFGGAEIDLVAAEAAA